MNMSADDHICSCCPEVIGLGNQKTGTTAVLHSLLFLLREVLSSGNSFLTKQHVVAISDFPVFGRLWLNGTASFRRSSVALSSTEERRKEDVRSSGGTSEAPEGSSSSSVSRSRSVTAADVRSSAAPAGTPDWPTPDWRFCALLHATRLHFGSRTEPNVFLTPPHITRATCNPGFTLLKAPSLTPYYRTLRRLCPFSKFYLVVRGPVQTARSILDRLSLLGANWPPVPVRAKNNTNSNGGLRLLQWVHEIFGREVYQACAENRNFVHSIECVELLFERGWIRKAVASRLLAARRARLMSTASQIDT